MAMVYHASHLVKHTLFARQRGRCAQCKKRSRFDEFVLRAIEGKGEWIGDLQLVCNRCSLG